MQVSRVFRRASVRMFMKWLRRAFLDKTAAVCCTRPGCLENGESDYFHLSDLFFLAGVYPGFCLPPTFHRAGSSAATCGSFGGTPTRICSFPYFSAMLQDYPEIQPSQVMYGSHENTFHSLLLVNQKFRV